MSQQLKWHPREVFSTAWFTIREDAKRGILMVAAGAYRVGPHRQFLLLARDWAADGIPVMRFDYQGQGDSEGAGAFNFDSLMYDIRSAIDRFTLAV